MPIIDKSKEKIKLLERLVRERFEEALTLSMDLDHDAPEKATSPDMIQEQCGIGLDVLLKYYICVDKKRAVEFLAEVGKELSLPVLRKRFSSQHYEKKFGRRISKIGTIHVFTYSEILVLANHFVPLK